MRRKALLISTLFFFLWLAVGAVAQDYPITEDELVVSESSVSPGSRVAISGDGFVPGTEVVITIESTPVQLGRVTTDATGAFSTSVTLPADLAPGAHTLKATGAAASGGTLVLTAQVLVEGDLPFTGFRLPWWLVVAAGLGVIVGGVIALRTVRR